MAGAAGRLGVAQLYDDMMSAVNSSAPIFKRAHAPAFALPEVELST